MSVIIVQRGVTSLLNVSLVDSETSLDDDDSGDIDELDPCF